MDTFRFDQFAKSFGRLASRRSALGILSTFGLAGAALRIPAGVMAKKKRKHKKKDKKPKPNTFGCFNVGQACRGNSANCCSGICEGTKPKKGKKDKSRCVAHNALACPTGADFCFGDLTVCEASPSASCLRTTGQASFCARDLRCFPCRKDTDCEPTYGPGAACIVCEFPCPNGQHTGCALPSV